MGWKPALNAFAVTLADGMPAAENFQQDERRKHRLSDAPASLGLEPCFGGV